MNPIKPARRLRRTISATPWFLGLLAGIGSAQADDAALRDAAPLPDSGWIDVIDDVRRNDCRADADLPPLRADAALQRVAERYSTGGSLQQALEAARYRTGDAAALRIDAVRLDAATVRRQLRERFCVRLENPELAVAAALQRGNSLWLVVAVPDDGTAAPMPEEPEPQADDRPPTGEVPDGIEYEILAQVNEARSRPRRCGAQQFAAAPPLRYSATLADASQAHAMDMARRGYFDHDTPEGVKPAERLATTGYRWTLTGENIARGDMGADDAMAGWLRSPGHCANIMEPRFTEMGFGIAADGDRKGALYWVQTFAAPRDDETPR